MLRRTLYTHRLFKPHLERLNVREVVFEPLKSRPALIVERSDGYYIVISSSRNQRRSRNNFALAHELAHLELMQKSLPLPGEELLEQHCQRRAGEILVHPDLLEFAMEEYSRDPRVVRKSFFPHASLEVVTKRIAEYIDRRAYFHYQPFCNYFIFDPQEYVQERLDRPLSAEDGWMMYPVNTQYLVGLEDKKELP